MQSNMMQQNMMQQNMMQPNMMMGGQMINSGPRISEMGGGTPISQLRKDILETIPLHNDSESSKSTKSNKSNNMKFIVDDINNDSEIGPKNKKKKKSDDDDYKEEEDEEEEDDEEETKPKKKKKSSDFNLNNLNIPEMLKDPVLIWLIYMLMSQNFFKNLVGKYISSINPNEEGVVTIKGVAMYGLILVALYTLIKFILKIIIKKY